MKRLGMCAMAAMMMAAPAMAAEKITVETNDKCSFTIHAAAGPGASPCGAGFQTGGGRVL